MIKIPMTTGKPPQKQPVYILRIAKYDKEGVEIPNSEEYWVCDGVNKITVLEKFTSLDEAMQYVKNNPTFELV